jgi:hypothetical protein
LVPVTDSEPPDDCLLLFVIFTRAEVGEGEERSETVPANSNVAPDATVAVTPAPTVAAPEVLLNRSVPTFALIDVPPERFDAP